MKKIGQMWMVCGLALSAVNAGAGEGGGHGVGNGGDPRELFLHNRLQVLIAHLEKTEVPAHFPRSAKSLRFRIGDASVGCFRLEGRTVWVAKDEGCFRRYADDADGLFAELMKTIARFAQSEGTVQESAEFAAIPRPSAQVLLSSRRYFWHPTCEIRADRSVRVKKSERSAVAEVLRSRGYQFSTLASESLSFAFQRNEAIVMSVSAGNENRGTAMNYWLSGGEDALTTGDGLMLDRTTIDATQLLTVSAKLVHLPWCLRLAEGDEP